MRLALFLTVLAMLCPMPLAAEGGGSAGGVGSVSAPSDVCELLIIEAQGVSRVLRTVSDRESADKAADDLHNRLQKMNDLCRRLEAVSIDSEEELRALTTSMRSLTHIIQGCYPVVKRLLEVNAYGSEKLVQVFNTHRLPTALHPVEGEAESADVALYLEWGDALEDALCHLRSVRSAAEAEAIAVSLTQSVEWAESCSRRVNERMENNTARDNDTQLMPAIERCRSFRRMIQTEKTRLKDAGLLRVPLLDLVERVLR